MSLFTLLGESTFGLETPEVKLTRLLTEAQSLAEQLRHEQNTKNNAAINQLIESSKRLTRTLQTPTTRAWDLFFQPHALPVLQIALDNGWLHALRTAGAEGLSVNELASSGSSSSTSSTTTTNSPPSADASFVRRLLRLLAASGILNEVSKDRYAGTEFSDLFCTPEWAGGLRHARRGYGVTVSTMPDYFSGERGLRVPGEGEKGLYEFAHGQKFLEFLGRDHGAARDFDVFMKAVREGGRHWMEDFPVEQKLHADRDEDVFLVDMGGGKGHELVSIAGTQKRLSLKGRLVLQDLPRVLDRVPEEWKQAFEVQAHDFFTPQPVIHARAYYLRNVLHGWTDEDCVRILSHIRDAMKPGYSKLLVNEIVLPNQRCGFWGAAFDLSMMAVVNGRLRTEGEWKELVGRVGGLMVRKVWKIGMDGEGLVEVDRE